jgi:hypothetical protein
VHHAADARRRGRFADRARPEGLDGVKGLPAGLGKDADQVDHRVGADQRPVDRPSIAQVRLDGLDLPDGAERVQVAGQIGPAHRHAHAVTTLGQRMHHVAADKARAPENRDELGGRPRRLHACSYALDW